ncbi:MAG: PIN domain-containing protein [Thermoproteales archaeon]|nr:PIN domain-containing protein [Thermoproteales archaeon]
MLIENDLIFAFLNKYDKNYTVAYEIFKKIKNGELKVEASSISLLEMELIYKSENRESQLFRDLAALASFENIKFIPLTPEITLASVYIRQETGLSFFDSHYAATALSLDRKILSFDKSYENVEGLIRIDPKDII